MINAANLKKRLAFVAVAVPVAFIIVNSQVSISKFCLRILGLSIDLLPPIYPGQILALALVMLGASEYTKMLSAANPKNAFWLGRVWIWIVSCAYLVNYPIPATISNSALLIIVAFEAFAFGKNAPQGRWKRASLFFTGMIFLNIAAICTMALYRAPITALFSPPNIPMAGRLDVVAIAAATFMCDSAAYFVGSAWGRRRLSPDISPNKTIEGSVGGLATSILVMTVFWLFTRNPGYPIYMGVILGAIIGVTAQVGDLLMSLIKRYFQVKDASNMIPGHGGILDRFDSLFFTMPVIHLFAWLVTR